MRTRKTIIALILLSLLQCAPGQQEQRSVLLPAHEVKAVASRYSRERSEKFDGSWQPAKADLDDLEANLSQISNLKIYGWDSKIHIDHPGQYFRQYVAVRVAGQKRIFVSAFCDEKPPSDWHDRLYVVIDGATCYWQAIYDPAAKQFSNLRINARA
jgi:hypothetical protein